MRIRPLIAPTIAVAASAVLVLGAAACTQADQKKAETHAKAAGDKAEHVAAQTGAAVESGAKKAAEAVESGAGKVANKLEDKQAPHDGRPAADNPPADTRAPAKY